VTSVVCLDHFSNFVGLSKGSLTVHPKILKSAISINSDSRQVASTGGRPVNHKYVPVVIRVAPDTVSSPGRNRPPDVRPD